SSDCGAIGLRTLKFEFDPAVTVAGICEELIGVIVRDNGTTDDGINVLVSVVIEIAESDAMALLQLAESAGSGYVLKTDASVIAEHPAGNQRRELRISGPDVEVEPAVVVQVTKVATHRVQKLVDASVARD